tara:strand:- start:178 stop:567 length:390 start_codon:yes stop_codon:yes gene_type:complete
VKLSKIKQLVEEKFDSKLNRRSRKRPYVYQRAVYFKICKEKAKCSLEQIGRTVNKDHATVLHGIKIFDLFDEWKEDEYIKVYQEVIGILEDNEAKKRMNTHLTRKNFNAHILNKIIYLRGELEKLKKNY